MRPLTDRRVPEALPVVAKATGSDDGGRPMTAIVTQSRGGRVYYVEAWQTGTGSYCGAWETRSRDEIDTTLETLRAAGFGVTEYAEVVRWRAWAGESDDTCVTCVTYETPAGRPCEPRYSRAVRIQHVSHDEAVRMMRSGIAGAGAAQ